VWCVIIVILLVICCGCWCGYRQRRRRADKGVAWTIQKSRSSEWERYLYNTPAVHHHHHHHHHATTTNQHFLGFISAEPRPKPAGRADVEDVTFEVSSARFIAGLRLINRRRAADSSPMSGRCIAEEVADVTLPNGRGGGRR